MKLVFWLSIVLICFCVANASEASPAAKPAQTSSDYDLQSLVWEHDAIFNGVLDWALEKGVLNSKQAATLQAELEARLQAFADLPGTDVNGMLFYYLFLTLLRTHWYYAPHHPNQLQQWKRSLFSRGSAYGSLALYHSLLPSLDPPLSHASFSDHAFSPHSAPSHLHVHQFEAVGS